MPKYIDIMYFYILQASRIHARDKYRDWINKIFVTLHDLSAEAPENAQVDVLIIFTAKKTPTFIFN